MDPERTDLLDRLRLDALRIAEHFGLEYKGIAAEHPRVKSRYGVCYSDGLIKIRLYHARTGKPLKYSSLVDTLCHELAHLRHFDHGPEFKAFFLRVLNWARRQGIYQPGPRAGRRRPEATWGDRRDEGRFGRPPRPLPTRNGVAVFRAEESAAAIRSPGREVLPWERPRPSKVTDGPTSPAPPPASAAAPAPAPAAATATPPGPAVSAASAIVAARLADEPAQEIQTEVTPPGARPPAAPGKEAGVTTTPGTASSSSPENPGRRGEQLSLFGLTIALCLGAAAISSAPLGEVGGSAASPLAARCRAIGMADGR